MIVVYNILTGYNYATCPYLTAFNLNICSKIYITLIVASVLNQLDHQN